MTIKEKIKELLVNNGMFENQAEDVITLVVSDKTNEAMIGRWDDDVLDYPAIMLQILWSSTRRIAIKWIDDNLPSAWFRPMFELDD